MRLGDRPDDSPARFLDELRTLRSRAGLHYDELAARAHYPLDLLQAAEAGPSLPDLPVLSAYVRACEGPVAEWEDRWRALTGSSDESGLPMRAVGSSAAAVAGARAGASVAPPEEHDPARIMAVLSRATTESGTSAENGHSPAAGIPAGNRIASTAGSSYAAGSSSAAGSSFANGYVPPSQAPLADVYGSSAPEPGPAPEHGRAGIEKQTPVPPPLHYAPAARNAAVRHGIANPRRRRRSSTVPSGTAMALIVTMTLVLVGLLIAVLS